MHLSYTMSVDVFGRQLPSRSVIRSGRGPPGERGPPGDGFKRTDDDQYDVDGRRLCNLADPMQRNDAVTLGVTQNLMQQESRMFHTITASLRNDVDDVSLIVHALEPNWREDLNKLRTDSETTHELVIRNSEAIYRLDTRLGATATINDVNLTVEALESRLRKDLRRQNEDSQSIQKLAIRSSELISQLDARLTALEEQWKMKNSP